MTTLRQFTVKDANTVRDDILRTIRNGLIRRGVSNPNVGPNSDWYLIGTAVGAQLAVIGANCIVRCDQLMPDTATEDDLARQGTVLGKTKQAAAGSLGSIIIVCSATAPVTTGSQLTDSGGLRYEVTIGGSYANGAAVPIRAIDVGIATNHDEGDQLQWASAPPYCDDKVIVAAGGLINGIDEEDDEGLRTRILATFQVPPGSGNWEHVAEVAEGSTSHVQKDFVYPAILGPSTYGTAVTAAPTATEKTRNVDTTVVNGTVIPYVSGKLPQHAYLNATTVTNVNADVAMGLSLPDAPTASPPGLGGGWIDGTPWPRPDNLSSFRCTVTLVTSTTAIRVDSVGPPLAGVSHIAWLSPLTWRVHKALISSYSGSTGAYDIILDQPLPGIMVGAYIWPDFVQAEDCVAAMLAAFALMGPGEKTANAAALVRGFRHPPPSVGWPYALGPHLERAMTDVAEEILAAQFFHRTDGTTTMTGAAGQLVPQVPAAASDPPKQLVPHHIAFYRIP